jgi:1-acyl-sn-glycerol-3-phosphate acyltransferase
MLYRFAQLLVRSLWPLFGRVEAEGLENVPDHGPFILIANHQSYLEAVLFGAVVKRPFHTMSKSTQFNDPITGWIIKALKGFPVRRFQVDPQAVRIALRVLEQGEGLGIYIEGERKAGVPVVPVGISGGYEIWPRWGRPRFRRGTVSFRFGPPIRFPKLDDKAAREAALYDARERIVSSLAELAGVERGRYV